MGSHLKIAVIGDIHDRWYPLDNLVLEALKVDLALFVGDFGNESVEVVRHIAALKIPKAAIMGNHDAWYTATAWGRKKCPYDRSKEDRVQQQLDLLGNTHVGYGKLDLDKFSLSIVGGRPYSWGGSEWKNNEFLIEKYNIPDFEASTLKIIENVRDTAHDTLIFLGHNGPRGLGEGAEDICGKDWQPIGGDHGDPDLALAIENAREMGKRVALVTFGHMHHKLRHTEARLRERVVYKEGTLYLNAASVPRIRDIDGVECRNFSIVDLIDGKVQEASLIWVEGNGKIKEKEILYP